MLQNPSQIWPGALGQGRGSPKVESTGKRDREGMFELLLLFINVWAACGVVRSKCRAGPVRGMAGRGGGGKPDPKKGS